MTNRFSAIFAFALEHRFSIIDWSLIAIIAGLDAVFGWLTGIHIAGAGERVLSLATLFGPWWIVILIVVRLTGIGVSHLGEMPLKVLMAAHVTALFQYYAARSALPLVDAQLDAADKALGFDWISYYNWATTGPLSAALRFAYDEFLPEAGVIAVLLALFAPDRARRFVTAYLISIVIALLVFAVFPAAGPFATSGMTDLPPESGFVQEFLAAHNRTTVSPEHIIGLISFPSYHACAAVLLTYLVRGLPVIFPLTLAMNGAMIVGTPAFGGHYLMDVIAGILLAVATVAILRAINGAAVRRNAAPRPRLVKKQRAGHPAWESQGWDGVKDKQ